MAASTASINKPEAPKAEAKTEKESIVPVAAPVAVGGASAASSSIGASPAKPVSKPIMSNSSAAVDPRDTKIAALQSRNQELTKQVEELQKTLAKSSSASSQQVPPEWIALLNSQTGFPPVLVVLIALFSFFVGLLF